MPKQQSARMGDLFNHLGNRTFRSLRTRNYRLYFAAQSISSSGTWVQLVAVNWLVLRLGGSGLALGITTAMQFAPLLLFSAYGGVLVDRWNKRTLLTVTQSTAGLLTLSLGLLVLTGIVQIWIVWVAAFLLGSVDALDTPGHQAFTVELVGPTDATNAVALNNTVSTSARAIGPAIGGILVAVAGIAPSFLINAASYVVVVAALRRIDPSALHIEPPAPRHPGQVREGLRHVWKTQDLRRVLLVVTLVSIFGLNFQVLLPLIAFQTFTQGAGLYGLLMSCMGIGAVIGSLAVASWTDPTVCRIGALAIVFGVANTAVAFAPNLLLGFLAVGVMGIGSSLFLASSSGYLLVHAGELMRGRVMALYSIAFLGTAPIGGPLLGWTAERFGARIGFLVAGGACVIAGGLVLLARHTRNGRSSRDDNKGVR